MKRLLVLEISNRMNNISERYTEFAEIYFSGKSKIFQMNRTKSGNIVIGIVCLLLFSFIIESCNLGKKSCGCGMDLNGTVKRKHWYSRN